MNAPCILSNFEDPFANNNISPFPNNFSAPITSNIVLESTWDLNANEILLGKLAFINPVTISVDGLWVATTRWIPTALAFWAILTIDSSTPPETVIIKSANSSMIITINGIFSTKFNLL